MINIQRDGEIIAERLEKFYNRPVSEAEAILAWNGFTQALSAGPWLTLNDKNWSLFEKIVLNKEPTTLSDE